MIIVETSRLLLRSLNYSDLEDYYEINRDYKVSYLQGFKSFSSLLEAREKLAKAIILNQEYAIVLKENKKVIGTFSIHPYSLTKSYINKNYTIGYVINKNYQHLGYMSELLPKVLYFIFHDLKANCIWVSHLLGNKTSKKLIKNNQFIFLKYGIYYFKDLKLLRLRKIYYLKSQAK